MWISGFLTQNPEIKAFLCCRDSQCPTAKMLHGSCHHSFH
ncbi:unnamed protein product [Gulo gulo]|uniref:Uncharacterized protein n=1 Tax=Gulo gulo TaxID=48420 RepID=A0A9X9LPW7_GULGU|nr:unnamed protein product [Gulo gulo]